MDLLSVKELTEYLPDKPAKATIYTWTCLGKIPFRKYGKKLFFDKDAIYEWNKNGRPANDQQKESLQ